MSIVYVFVMQFCNCNLNLSRILTECMPINASYVLVPLSRQVAVNGCFWSLYIAWCHKCIQLNLICSEGINFKISLESEAIKIWYS